MLKIIELLRSEYKSEYTNDMPEKDYILPKIYHGGEDYDLSKRWYVYYSYRNPKTGVMTRQPAIYFNVNRDFHTKRERLNALRKIQKNLTELLKSGRSPYMIDEKKNYTIKSAIKWALEIKKTTLSESTKIDYDSRVRVFLEFLERNFYDVILVQDFQKKYILEFLNEIIKKNSTKTYNNYRLVLSSLFAVLKENDIILDNYIQDIKPLKTKPKRNKSYSQEQVDILFSTIENKDPLLFRFIQFVSYNFLRPIEVVRLRYKDLKINENPPFLEVRAKNKLEKTKIIPQILLKEIKTMDFSNPEELVFKTNEKGIETNEVNRRNFFTKRFTEIKKELKLGSEYTMYSFRHTFITKLYREIRKEKTELETYDVLMKITGHNTLTALKMYLRDIDAELAEDYSKYLEQ